jgi:hypothetical protein
MPLCLSIALCLLFQLVSVGGLTQIALWAHKGARHV